MTHVHVAEGIYIGSAKSLNDHEFLRNENIGLIINASNRVRNQTELPIPTVLVLDIKDTVVPKNQAHAFIKALQSKADSVAPIIDDALVNSNVLVHCHAGINRSAFIIANYLIKYKKMKPKDVIAILRNVNKKHRNIRALSNPLFESILMHL